MRALSMNAREVFAYLCARIDRGGREVSEAFRKTRFAEF